MRGPLTLLKRGLGAFRRDRRGVSAVEFALISPVLILTYFGLAELSQGMMAQRRVSHAASAVGDLVAQSDGITNAGMSDIFAASETILSPFPTTSLKVRVTSVTGDAQGVPKVDWSDGHGGMAPLAQGSTVTLPAGLITAAGDNVIMSEATYKYDAVVKYVIKNGLNFSEKFYLRPRKVNKVPRTAS
jgi:Flp pilus assembly protein TadG